MKIIIKQDDNPHTGKGFFAQRLMPALRELGVEITADTSKRADIALHIGRVHYKANVRKNIIRVGPACVDSNKNHKAINKAKAESVKKCDAVIYQSQYSKKVYHHLVCKPNVPETIIFNGAPTVERKQGSRPMFLMATRRWWPQKRLKYAIRAFAEADILGSVLTVCGDSSMTKWRKTARIRCDKADVFFAGVVNQETLAKLRAVANAQLHLTYLDACPNSVAEALTAGCPVIGTNQGGTPELISCDKSGNSVILDIDKPYKYTIADLNKPPKISIDELVTQLYLYSVQQKNAEAPDLDINVIARQYKEFFELCLK